MQESAVRALVDLYEVVMGDFLLDAKLKFDTAPIWLLSIALYCSSGDLSRSRFVLGRSSFNSYSWSFFPSIYFYKI